jgi:hypothetical protein
VSSVSTPRLPDGVTPGIIAPSARVLDAGRLPTGDRQRRSARLSFINA